MKRIGIDTGGTFTDGVLWDDETGLITTVKVSSVREDPAKAVLAAVDKLGGSEDVRYLMHGTTVATNASLEGEGPRVALLCTEGFRDVLEIARLMRQPDQLYDIRTAPAPSLVRRRDRLEVKERISHTGEVVAALDEERIIEITKILKKRSIKSIAVCFLHSYVNNAHERRAKELLAREMPDANISLSCEVLPEFREYERTSTTVLNTYLSPVIAGYLQRLQGAMSQLGEQTRLWIMQSNGGVASAKRAADLPVTLLLSGPSGGIVAGRHLMDQVGIKNGITMDMGGTSYDVCLLADRTIPVVHERHVLDMPVKVPSVDILTIGAGGGSIGWVDVAGQFQVGPRSAGAVPGPACYGRGGEDATVTDANLVLGILGDGQKLGGEVGLDSAAAHRACERLGKRLGLNAIQAAWGIRRIINTAMAGATHAISVGKGHDPRDFTMIAFGGAGPMHAVDIAAELEIPQILIPGVPGCYSALGLVVSDVAHDYVVTRLVLLEDNLEAGLRDTFAQLMEAAEQELADEGIEPKQRDFFPALEMRYLGEQSSITVDVSPRRVRWLSQARKAFHQQHERLYGFQAADEPVELVNIRLRSVGRLYRAKARGVPRRARSNRRPVPSSYRQVYFSSKEHIKVPVFSREAIAQAAEFTGPAIVEQSDATLIVPPKRKIRIDDLNNLWVR